MAFFYAHGVLMAGGLLLVFLALCVAATQRRKHWWLRVHRTSGLAGTAIMLTGTLAAMIAVTASANGHLRTPHTWLGALTVLTAAAAPVLGLLQFRIRTNLGTIRAAHRLCGRVLMVVALLTTLSGLYLAGFF